MFVKDKSKLEKRTGFESFLALESVTSTKCTHEHLGRTRIQGSVPYSNMYNVPSLNTVTHW